MFYQEFFALTLVFNSSSLKYLITEFLGVFLESAPKTNILTFSTQKRIHVRNSQEQLLYNN